jgi:HSF-type DNA-binding
MASPALAIQPDPAWPLPQANGGNFPAKLHVCLTELERHGLDHVASFQPHGRCFLVHKQEDFVRKVLPRYVEEHWSKLFVVCFNVRAQLTICSLLPLIAVFSWFKQTKYSSFQRQLNIYGFMRIASGTPSRCVAELMVVTRLSHSHRFFRSGIDKGGYYHPMFLRGKPNLLAYVVRKAIKGTGPRRPSIQAADPDFYALPCLEAASMTTGSLLAPMASSSRSEVPTTNSLVYWTRVPQGNGHLAHSCEPKATTLVREQITIVPQAVSILAGHHLLHVHGSTVDMTLVALLQQRLLMEQRNALIRFLRSSDAIRYSSPVVHAGQPTYQRESSTSTRSADGILQNDYWSSRI